MTKIYWAASLHDKVEQDRNIREVKKLRNAGFEVFLPQEEGVWEDIVREEREKDPFQKEIDIIRNVRKRLYDIDKDNIDDSHWVIAFIDRAPSEGTLWELGYATGLDVPQILVNACEWEFNIMPEFGVETIVTSTEAAIEYIKRYDQI